MGVNVAVGVMVGEGVIVIVGVAAGPICGGSVQARLTTIVIRMLPSTDRTFGELDMERNINDDYASVNKIWAEPKNLNV